MKAQLLLTAVLLAASPAGAATMELNSANLGAAWPFTVERGTLECHKNLFITFTAQSRIYAINGSATTYAKSQQLPWLDVRPIWRNNPEIPGTKIPISAVIERGAALCKAR